MDRVPRRNGRPPERKKRRLRGAGPAFLAALALALSSCGEIHERPRLSPPASQADRASGKAPRLLQGPMVGFASDREAWVWVRASGPARVRVRYRREGGEEAADEETSEAVQALPERDHTAVIPLKGLQPGAAYRYRVIVEEEDATGPRKPFFRTLPPAGRPGRFRVAFGADVSVDFDPVQRIWKAVTRARPDAFLWLGDNVYTYSADPDDLRAKYRRQRSVEALLDFQASVPQLAIWGDHDYGHNDSDRRFRTKDKSQAVFQEYWANPQYGLPGEPGPSKPPVMSQTALAPQTPKASQTAGMTQTAQTPPAARMPRTPGSPRKRGLPKTSGIYFQWAIGNVDFFFLDSRSERDSNSLPDGLMKTQLGFRQRAWLKAMLKKSRAVFKVLVSSDTWTQRKRISKDSWASFLYERDQIFDFIRDEGIRGVFLIAGDIHRPMMNVLPWSERGGYDLYETISSPLAQRVIRRPLREGKFRRLRPPSVFAVNFGLLEFDTAADPARVTIHLMDAEGKDLWTPLTLEADELRPGVRSWDRKLIPPPKREDPRP
ncbi:MAG: alkaline phosphatase D family protein [Candidatus Tectomicrobia bacterium]|nr:alkaline phosphatase D family protein [Candidatus Tectomicrobia bacterium]